MQSWETSNTGCVKYQWTKAGSFSPSVPTPGARKTSEKAKCINPFKWRMTKDQRKRGPSEQRRGELKDTMKRTLTLNCYKSYTSKLNIKFTHQRSHPVCRRIPSPPTFHPPFPLKEMTIILKWVHWIYIKKWPTNIGIPSKQSTFPFFILYWECTNQFLPRAFKFT